MIIPKTIKLHVINEISSLSTLVFLYMSNFGSDNEIIPNYLISNIICAFSPNLSMFIGTSDLFRAAYIPMNIIYKSVIIYNNPPYQYKISKYAPDIKFIRFQPFCWEGFAGY